MLDLAYRRARREDPQDMEAERGGELETRKQEDLLLQPTVLGQLLRFIGGQSFERFEQLVLLDLLLHLAVTGDGIVVGEGGDVEAASFAAAQDVDVTDAGLLVIVGGRR